MSMGMGMGMGMGMDMGMGMHSVVPMWAYQQQRKQMHDLSMRNEVARMQAASDRQKLMEMSCAQPTYFPF